MRIWQRGTSFTPGVGTPTYCADRFEVNWGGTGTSTFSQQAFTAGTAPVAGYEAINFLRLGMSSGATYVYAAQKIEDVRAFAGQTITVSFWAKANNGFTNRPIIRQFFGTGGSANVDKTGADTTLTTSWTRYSYTVTLDSIAGKTIGTNNALIIYFINYQSGTIASTNVDIWGVQVEAGNTATAFQTATGTLAGELAACQRYYYKHVEGATQSFGIGYYYSASEMAGYVQFPVTMRTTPTLSITSGTNYYGMSRNGGDDYVNSFTIVQASTTGSGFNNLTEASGTAGQAGALRTHNASSFMAFSAELQNEKTI